MKIIITKLDGQDRGILKSVLISYALPAQEIESSGYCPILKSRLCLTNPITIEACPDIPIVPVKFGYFTEKLGFPLLSVRTDELKKNETILALDRMTMYFEQLLLEQKHETLSPLGGWKNG